MNNLSPWKHLIPFLLANLIIYSSCHKSGSTPPPHKPSPYYLRCTINGADAVSDSSPVSRTNQSIRPGFLETYIIVSGIFRGDNTSQTFGFTIDNGFSGYNYGKALPIVAGTYGISNRDFQVNSGYDSTGGGVSKHYVADCTQNFPDTGNFFTISITSIDSTSIKGTFSGKVYLDSRPAGASNVPYGPQCDTITNGTFYVAR